MARFLFTLWDGGGSLPPELTVVRQLVAAGHTVSVLGDPVTETEVCAVGVTDFRPWVGAPHHDTRRAEDDYVRDWELRNPTRVLANLMDTLMVTPAPLFAAETLAAIDDVQPDAVASSFPLLGALMAAETRRIPCAALVPNVVSLPAEGMPPFGTGFLPPKGRLGRARDRALNALVDRMWNKGLPELNSTRASLGLRPLVRGGEGPYHDVVEHAAGGKGLDDLEGAGQPLAAEVPGPLVVDLLPAKDDLPRGGREHAGDAVEQRGLAGAVRPDQAKDFTFFDAQAEVLHRLDAAECFSHLRQLENLHAAASLPPHIRSITRL